MEFKEAVRIWKRMCKTIEECDDCPMCAKYACQATPDIQDESLIESILAKWAAEHPEKTFMDDFFEKHPRAEKSADGFPRACAKVIGYVKMCPLGLTPCNDCWRRPLEEVE